MDADIRSAASVMSIDTDTQSLPYGGTQQQVVSVSGEHTPGSLDPPTFPSTSRHFSEHDLQHYEKHSSNSDRNNSRGKGEHFSGHPLDAEDAYPPRPPTNHAQHDSRNLTEGGGATSSSSRVEKEVDQPNIRISFDSVRERNGLTRRSKDVSMREIDRDIDTAKEVDTDMSTAKQSGNLHFSIGSRSINSSMQERAERLVSREASVERQRVKESHHPPSLSLPLSLPSPTSTSTGPLRESGLPYNLRTGSTYPSSTGEMKSISALGPMHAVTNTCAPLTNSDIIGGGSTSLGAALREKEREREKKLEVKEEREREREVKEEKEKDKDEKVGVVARFDRLQSMFERVTGNAVSAVWRDSDSSDSDD